MGRKSLAAKRREELLDAFERCIVKFGLEGTSLEQIADEAGMTRSIIRHYIGNRDALVDALIERIIQQTTAQLQQDYEGLKPAESLQYTLDSMFGPHPTLNPHDKIIIDILMTAQERYPRAKRMLVALFEGIVQSFADDLARVYPQATPSQCRQVAYAILCLAEMHGSFMWLGMNARYNADARAAAEALLQTLA